MISCGILRNSAERNIIPKWANILYKKIPNINLLNNHHSTNVKITISLKRMCHNEHCDYRREKYTALQTKGSCKIRSLFLIRINELHFLLMFLTVIIYATMCPIYIGLVYLSRVSSNYNILLIKFFSNYRICPYNGIIGNNRIF